MSHPDREALLAAILETFQTHWDLLDELDEKSAVAFGINTTDMRALRVIDRFRGITAGGLARKLLLSSGATTTVLDRLVEKGYAVRGTGPVDRRQVIVELTPLAVERMTILYGPEDEFSIYDAHSVSDLVIVERFMSSATEWLETRFDRIGLLPTD